MAELRPNLDRRSRRARRPSWPSSGSGQRGASADALQPQRPL